ncbi:MAG TPA: hypothetical protein VGB76_04950 [Pyrinomonadaceae bacterium]|jgi:hypothetical protein
MHKLLSQLLTRFAAAALTFAVALCATLSWRALPAPRLPPHTSAGAFAGLTQAAVETPMSPEHAAEAVGRYWIFRRGFAPTEHDIRRPLAIPAPDENLIAFGCVTLTVSLDDARRLRLNGDKAGSLHDPASLNVKLEGIFDEREANRAYKPGMEYRTELPSGERIDRTVIIDAAASSSYGEILELVSLLERTGANPIVLHTGDRRAYAWEAMPE